MLIIVDVPASFPLDPEAELDPRLQVSQVCADWRRIAFDTPELWKLTYSSIPKSSSPSKLGNAWWSQCSGSRFSLVMDSQYVKSSTGLFDGITHDHFIFDNTIAPYSARVVELQIVVKAETARRLLALPAGSFVALETLWMRVEENREANPLRLGDCQNTAFALSPYLSDVTFCASSMADPWLLHMLWVQLTHLVLVTPGIPADRVILLLSQCPVLNICSINSVKAIDARSPRIKGQVTMAFAEADMAPDLF
jgi:hypothetical protein